MTLFEAMNTVGLPVPESWSWLALSLMVAARRAKKVEGAVGHKP